MFGPWSTPPRQTGQPRANRVARSGARPYVAGDDDSGERVRRRLGGIRRRPAGGRVARGDPTRPANDGLVPVLGFDPATYLVAVEQRTGDYLGLMRLWLKEAGPRFGFLAVLPRWRRTRITYTLVATIFAEVGRRGYGEVVAEIDATNRASRAVAERAGAVRVGGSYELCRRRPR